MKTGITQSLAASLSLLAFTAFAADSSTVVESKVTLGNFQYTLTDLKPWDVVAPSLKSPTGVFTLEASGFGVPGTSTFNATPFDKVNGSASASTQYAPAGTSVASKSGNSVSSQVMLSTTRSSNLEPAASQPEPILHPDGEQHQHQEPAGVARAQ